MSSDLVSRLPSIYRNAHDIKNKSSAPSRVPPPFVPQGTSGKAGGKVRLVGSGKAGGEHGRSWTGGSRIPASHYTDHVTLGKSGAAFSKTELMMLS